MAFFSNLVLHPLFSRASISVQVNNLEESEQSVVITYEGGRRYSGQEPLKRSCVLGLQVNGTRGWLSNLWMGQGWQ